MPKQNTKRVPFWLKIASALAAGAVLADALSRGGNTQQNKGKNEVPGCTPPNILLNPCGITLDTTTMQPIITDCGRPNKDVIKFTEEPGLAYLVTDYAKGLFAYVHQSCASHIERVTVKLGKLYTQDKACGLTVTKDNDEVIVNQAEAGQVVYQDKVFITDNPLPACGYIYTPDDKKLNIHQHPGTKPPKKRDKDTSTWTARAEKSATAHGQKQRQ